ncbi:MAG: type II toxin-antitoxin system HicA family toxin [Planctomycetes bacterium]|nr:type II toxin-antitoxin system HicA family toxin [Planctomycetota bacterium]
MGGRLPSVSVRDAVRAFERGGFQVVPGRGKGSHIAMARDGWHAILVIPAHGDVPRGTLRALIRQSGLTVEQFLKLL